MVSAVDVSCHKLRHSSRNIVSAEYFHNYISYLTPLCKDDNF